MSFQSARMICNIVSLLEFLKPLRYNSCGHSFPDKYLYMHARGPHYILCKSVVICSFGNGQPKKVWFAKHDGDMSGK